MRLINRSARPFSPKTTLRLPRFRIPARNTPRRPSRDGERRAASPTGPAACLKIRWRLPDGPRRIVGRWESNPLRHSAPFRFCCAKSLALPQLLKSWSSQQITILNVLSSSPPIVIWHRQVVSVDKQATAGYPMTSRARGPALRNGVKKATPRLLSRSPAAYFKSRVAFP
jgi:hypothetical protein